jgi:hypothetical protein
MEGVSVFYSISAVRWRSTSAATTAGRGALVEVANARASRDGDEDEDVVFSLIHAKGYLGMFGPCWAEAVGLLVGCHGQVRFR